jgi:hypothetical protein
MANSKKQNKKVLSMHASTDRLKRDGMRKTWNSTRHRDRCNKRTLQKHGGILMTQGKCDTDPQGVTSIVTGARGVTDGTRIARTIERHALALAARASPLALQLRFEPLRAHAAVVLGAVGANQLGTHAAR